MRHEGGVVLSSPSSVPEILPQSPPPQLPSLGWALRRAALWLLMLFVMVFVLGWLFYAGIDPDEIDLIVVVFMPLGLQAQGHRAE